MVDVFRFLLIFNFSFLRSVLASNNLTGTIPSLDLSFITKLDLSNNSLSGTVPSLVIAISNLTYDHRSSIAFCLFSDRFQHFQTYNA